MAKKDEINLFERFLIMSFGVGVVLAGLYPLTRQYGGVENFIKAKTQKASKIYDNLEKSIGHSSTIPPELGRL
jgi:hypothetical protein